MRAAAYVSPATRPVFSAAGCVRVAWHVAVAGGRRRLELVWSEEGGPPVEPPTRQGFGSRLIERTLSGDIDGVAELTFAPTGLVCRLSVPLKAPESLDARDA